MRSNGNCRGVSYWESHTGCLHTGDTVRHRLQFTALNQLDIGEAQHRWSCSTIGAPFEPDPVVSVRGLDSKSSLQPAGISRCTSNPGFSRSKSDFLFFFLFLGAKKFRGEGGRGVGRGIWRETRTPEKEEEVAGEGEKGRWRGKGHKASGKEEEKERKEKKK